LSQRRERLAIVGPLARRRAIDTVFIDRTVWLAIVAFVVYGSRYWFGRR
jgi:hypothetical protein